MSLRHPVSDLSSGSSELSCLVSARPYESCKIFKGRPRRNAFSKLVHRLNCLYSQKVCSQVNLLHAFNIGYPFGLALFAHIVGLFTHTTGLFCGYHRALLQILWGSFVDIIKLLHELNI